MAIAIAKKLDLHVANQVSAELAARFREDVGENGYFEDRSNMAQFRGRIIMGNDYISTCGRGGKIPNYNGRLQIG